MNVLITWLMMALTLRGALDYREDKDGRRLKLWWQSGVSVSKQVSDG